MIGIDTNGTKHCHDRPFVQSVITCVPEDNLGIDDGNGFLLANQRKQGRRRTMSLNSSPLMPLSDIGTHMNASRNSTLHTKCNEEMLRCVFFHLILISSSEEYLSRCVPTPMSQVHYFL